MRILNHLLDRGLIWAHRNCDRLILAQHDALRESAGAHRQAEKELAAERATTADLRARLAAAEHAPRRALAVLREPQSLGHGCTDPLQAALAHHYMVWFGITELAERMERGGDTDTAAKLRRSADVHGKRLSAALEILAGPDRDDELLTHLEQMATWPIPVPAPRVEHTPAPAAARS